MVKVSVIMPVYNTGEILRQTIDSILAQTFTDFELIIIDDGSKDISPAICDEYAEKDTRVKVIHQPNGGICAARNTGISVAKGEYITFCDHDDLYMPRKLEVSYDLAKKYNADIVNVGYMDLRYPKKETAYSFKMKCLSREEVRLQLLQIALGENSGTVWNKLFKASLLSPTSFFNTKYTRGHEDINFNYRFLCKVKSYISTEEILYCHIIRDELSTSAKIYREVLIGMHDAIRNYNECIRSFGYNFTNNGNLYIKNYAGMLRCYCVYMMKVGCQLSEFKQHLSDIDRPICFEGFWKCSSIRLKDKIIFLLYVYEKFGMLYLLCKTFA